MIARQRLRSISKLNKLLLGSSTEMERTAALDLFCRSKQFGLVYSCVVSDGDSVSKAYIDIFAVYGVCEECKAVKKIYTNVRDASFTEWVKTEKYA